MAKQICFMVMPFSKKKTGLTSSQGPTEVDLDALWGREDVAAVATAEPATAETGRRLRPATDPVPSAPAAQRVVETTRVESTRVESKGVVVTIHIETPD